MILTTLSINSCKNSSEICQNQNYNFSGVKKYIFCKHVLTEIIKIYDTIYLQMTVKTVGSHIFHWVAHEAVLQVAHLLRSEILSVDGCVIAASPFVLCVCLCVGGGGLAGNRLVNHCQMHAQQIGITEFSCETTVFKELKRPVDF